MFSIPKGLSHRGQNLGVFMMKIKLGGERGKGMSALIDDEDFVKVSQYSWHEWGGYPITNIWINGRRTVRTMHRLIMDFPDCQVDHINHDKLDNRKENLRLCTMQQNNMNKKPNPGKAVKGVYKNRYGTWSVLIQVDRKRHFLGNFADKIEASRVYDAKAIELFGEFAWLNGL